MGEQTKNGQIYSIALYHQIHCLGQIRKYTWLLAEAVVMNDTEAAELMRYHIGEGDGADHINHCFDYLRQSITCAGDMTLEWPRLEANGDRFVVEGWGVPHQCKDPVSFFQYPNVSIRLLTACRLLSRNTWTQTISLTLLSQISPPTDGRNFIAIKEAMGDQIARARTRMRLKSRRSIVHSMIFFSDIPSKLEACYKLIEINV